MASIWSGVTDTTNALVTFFATLTDYTLWRSLGWLGLGIVLMAGGLALLAKDQLVTGTIRSAIGS